VVNTLFEKAKRITEKRFGVEKSIKKLAGYNGKGVDS
jgi:hypothetical protein